MKDLTPTQQDALKWIPFDTFKNVHHMVRTSTLKVLEKLGYIERKTVNHNPAYRRLK